MFKDAIPECFRSKLLTSDILTIFKQETYSHKYEKLPNIVIHSCQHIKEKMFFWKYVARKFSFVYLRYDRLRRNS